MNKASLSFNFFLNSLSIHQAPLIKKLSEKNKVTIYYDNDISARRKKLGWNIPDFGCAKLIKLDLLKINIQELKKRNVVNIYSGINSYENINHCLNLIAPLSDSKNLVQMESIDCSGFKGLLRKIKYIFLSKKYNKHIYAYLCQGSGSQYANLGFKNTYDFAYFLDAPIDNCFIENNVCRFIYLGSLSRNKQILEVASELKNSKIHLDIYGAELDVSVEKLEAKIHDSRRIKYKGVANYDDIPALLKNYDYLILPSKAEGWGAVISEALLSGVGVVVTDSAGIINYIHSKVEHKVYVYNFGEMTELPEFLSKLVPLTIQDRKKISGQAYCLSSNYGENLFHHILKE
ncbi:glycosyltransferase [Vibrio splendidus]|uniref:glycosyltransferase n=1 Tax=Vibrio splendidus TaxID=29497 RepID=UPI0024691A07|nr:glycosyltransferase [Vibrio splendidus]MDH5896586.1 glycosyltransferase [Vibrio splendidus]